MKHKDDEKRRRSFVRTYEVISRPYPRVFYRRGGVVITWLGRAIAFGVHA